MNIKQTNLELDVGCRDFCNDKKRSMSHFRQSPRIAALGNGATKWSPPFQSQGHHSAGS